VSPQLADGCKRQPEISNGNKQRDKGEHERVLAEARDTEVARHDRERDEPQDDRDQASSELYGGIPDDALGDVHARCL
jgi:hypothetical protein